MNPDKIKGKIMYIEDEVEALTTMMDFLNPRGFAVLPYITAEQAYDKLRELNPDLIIVDVRLIGETGLDFIERIQKEGIETPVIVITGYAGITDEIKERKLKIYGCFEKPFKFSQLYQSITQILEVNQL